MKQSAKEKSKDRLRAEHAVFVESCTQYYDSIYRYFLVVLGSEHDAKDCTQETFKRYYEHIAADDKIEYHKAYLYKIAKNIYMERQRKTALWDSMIASQTDTEKIRTALSTLDLLEIEHVEKNMGKIVANILESLNSAEKKLYIDFFISKKTIKQIAYENHFSPSYTGKKVKALQKRLISLVRSAVADEMR